MHLAIIFFDLERSSQSGWGKRRFAAKWNPQIPYENYTVEECMIIATIKMSISPQRRFDVLKILRSVAELCRDDPDCLGCNIYRDLTDTKVILLEEYWSSEENLNLHLRSEEYRNLLVVLEMALKQPEIRFDTVTDSTGIEIIERARKGLETI
jgi:quinol monooxygenase YgiN